MKSRVILVRYNGKVHPEWVGIHEILVSAEDFEELNSHAWRFLFAAGKGKRKKAFPYVQRTATAIERSQRAPDHVFMHKQVLGIHLLNQEGVPVRDRLTGDHKNHNRFDNRRENLEVKPHWQNAQGGRKAR